MKFILQTIRLALFCTSALVVPSVPFTIAVDEPRNVFTSLKDNSENDSEDIDCSKYHYDLVDESAQLSPFASSFTLSVTSSDILKELFDIHLSKEETGRMHYNIIRNFSTELGAQDPNFLAQNIAKAAEVAIPYITPSSLARVYSNTIERFLRDEAVLTPENALSLGETYSQFLATSVLNKKDVSDRSKVYILVEGSRDFLISTGVLNPEMLPLLASIYVDELLSARRRQCLTQDASRLPLLNSASSSSSSSASQIQSRNKNSKPQRILSALDITESYDLRSSPSSSSFQVQSENEKPTLEPEIFQSDFGDSAPSSPYSSSQIRSKKENHVFESPKTQPAFDLLNESFEDSNECHEWELSHKSPFIFWLIKSQGIKGILKKVFTAVKKAEASVFQHIFIQIISDVAREIGIPYPDAIFKVFLKMIKREFKFLSPSSFANAFFNSIERLLEKKRILKSENALKLAKMFYESIEEFFLPMFDLKLQEFDLLLYAVAKGTKKFLHLLGLYKFDTLSLFARYFIQELLDPKNSECFI